jgi:hypothetical protein
VVWIDGVGWAWGLTSDFAFVLEDCSMEFIFGCSDSVEGGFAAGTMEGDEPFVVFSLESFDHPKSFVREDPGLTT